MRGQGWQFFVLSFPVAVVALESIDLELLKCSRAIEIEELVLDPFSKPLIEFTVERNIVPTSVSSVLQELNHILINVMILRHFK